MEESKRFELLVPFDTLGFKASAFGQTMLTFLGETNGGRTRNNLIDSQVPLPFGLSPIVDGEDSIPIVHASYAGTTMAEDE